MIYGHGVEERQTVAHFLESRHGRDVYNLSRQADCLYDHYVNLRLYLDTFEPQTLLLFVFENDFSDLEVLRTPDELERIPEIDAYDYSRIQAHIDAQDPHAESWLRRTRHRSAVYRLIRGLRSKLKRAWEGRAPQHVDFAAPLLDPERFARIESYYQRILADLAQRCRARGTDLVVVLLDVGLGGQPVQARAREMLGRVTTRLDVGFFDTGGLMRDCASCQLPRDGHFTAEGHARLGGFLDEALRSRESPGRGPPDA
jgi:hypothetical protein